jgi:hypothetical protein
MSLSGRERAEGFPAALFAFQLLTPSERAEGFPAVLSVFQTLPPTEQEKGFQRSGSVEKPGNPDYVSSRLSSKRRTFSMSAL